MLCVGFPVHVEREVDQSTKALLALSELLFGPLALDKLSNLAADRRHQVQKSLVRLVDAMARQIDDAEDLGAEQDRKGEGRMQPVTCGGLRAKEGWVLYDIRNTGRLAAYPDPARQPPPGRKRAGPGRGLELRGFDPRPMPQLGAPQYALFSVDPPQRA